MSAKNQQRKRARRLRTVQAEFELREDVRALERHRPPRRRTLRPLIAALLAMETLSYDGAFSQE